ncbi:bone morphogenetic protein 2 [Salarias fasciatus]|uniref:bone morphogenetic protein 2 n=1 Tax=Salarias fasciatus TaxID=181472 RepID=UPI00117686DE|nr:bone morphogenetic protein 2-like [Salarias fasciatus]
MAAGAALRLCLLLAAQLSCVSQLWIPQPDARLSVEDLPRRPAVAPGKKAPEFMVDLFNTVSVSGGNPKTQKEILHGNIVRSFEDKGHPGERFHFFNLSSFDKEERMIKAEFRWFRKKQKFFLGKSHFFHFYKVDVFEVPDSRDEPQIGNLVTSRRVPLYTQGWEVFNVTQIVSRWIQNNQSNGILVVTSNPFGSWPDSSQQSKDEPDRNAYLVIFSDDGRSGASHQPFLGMIGRTVSVLDAPVCQTVMFQHALSTGGAEPTAAARLSPQDRRSRRRRSSSGFSSSRASRPCQRVPLYVDFDEIGWSGWIISPRGYNANHCRGSCPFPLGGGLAATNHATVLSIMHALRLSGDAVEPPCCVPDRLESISLLYFDDDENVVLKQYDDMVAVSCSCQ